VPFQVILSNPGLAAGMPLVECSPLDEGSNPPCVPVLQHSCQNQQAPVFFGDPAVRLNAVITAAGNHKLYSICDSGYTPAVRDLSALIVNHLGGDCLTGTLADPSRPICDVTDDTTNPNGSHVMTPIPECDDPPSAYPCWTLGAKDLCTNAPQGLGFTIERHGQPRPSYTTTTASCLSL
jgi:hypothetical protein